MKTGIITLCIAAGCLTASGQFFSAEETARKSQEEKAKLISSLPEDTQKEVYIQYCASEKTAFTKAQKMHPTKIHHTPEQRAAIQKKAENSRKNLLELYKTEISKEHNLDPAYLDQIIAAGKEKNWPKTAPASTP